MSIESIGGKLNLLSWLTTPYVALNGCAPIHAGFIPFKEMSAQRIQKEDYQDLAYLVGQKIEAKVLSVSCLSLAGLAALTFRP
eukprot:1160242-Pelagomonas_calceolata.AAC.4